MLNVFSPFTSLRDNRYNGSQRPHHTIFLVKASILFLFIILIVFEYALFKSWWFVDRYSYNKTWDWAPYKFWLRIGLALIPDVLTILTFVLILNPAHHATYSFHPVFALSSSLLMMSLYLAVCLFNPLLAYSNEVWLYNSDVWEKLVLAETGVQAVLWVLWVLMIGFSSKAVYEWRKEKRRGNIKMDGLEKGGEMV